jgi:hypothetical protein
MESARLMLERGVGLLRVTAPTYEPALKEARHAARVLDVDWPDDVAVDDIVRTLDRSNPHHGRCWPRPAERWAEPPTPRSTDRRQPIRSTPGSPPTTPT